MFSIRRSSGIQRNSKKSGFSLILVLIISMISLAIVGATLEVTVLSAGSGRVVSSSNSRYNFLQGAVEEGKAELKKAMYHAPEPIRYVGYDPGSDPVISNADDLLLDHDFSPALGKGVVVNRNITRNELGKLGIGGNSGGNIVVKIFDMQYPGDSVDAAAIHPAELKKLPPSMLLYGSGETSWPVSVDPDAGGGLSGTANNAGVYLIRASLTIGDRETVLDTSLIQSIDSL